MKRYAMQAFGALLGIAMLASASMVLAKTEKEIQQEIGKCQTDCKSQFPCSPSNTSRCNETTDCIKRCDCIVAGKSCNAVPAK